MRFIVHLQEKSHRRKGVKKGSYVEIKGLSPGTIKNSIASLTRWRQHWLGKFRFARFKTLPEALQYLLKVHKLSASALAKDAFADPVKLTNWSESKCHPSGDESSIENLKKIERYCRLHEGALTNLLKPTFKVGPRKQPEAVARTRYGQRQQSAVHERYKLNVFTGMLETEWQDWFNLMSPGLEPDGPIKRNKRWFVDPETSECPTGAKHKQTLAGLFGYALLPVEGKSFPIYKREKGKKGEKGKKVIAGYSPLLMGEGLEAKQLTLALVSDVALVKRYVEFRCKRAGGYNEETSQIINLCCMLLHEETGFVKQQPEYGQRLARPVPAKKWNAHCADAHKQLRRTLRSLKKNKLIVQTRVVEEPIDFILGSDHPMHYLFELADLMEADLPVSSASRMRAISYRNMFLTRFITSNPLRIKQFSIMKWCKDDTGNVYKDRDGRWCLRFSRKDFKNRSALDNDYHAEIAPSLVPYLEEYLSEYRPQLLGAEDCDYLFRPAQHGGSVVLRKSAVMPMRTDSLSSVLHDNARYYLRCLGFGAHAYRHIIAADYLKNDKDGLMVAASILHDRPQTVFKHYGHYQRIDFLKHWISYHESQFEIFRARRAQGALDHDSERLQHHAGACRRPSRQARH